MKVLFMGTPEFSVPCLKRLYSDKHDIVGVFTKPDMPKDRGHKLTEPPVKICAKELSVPVFQPLSLKSDDVIETIKNLAPEIIIVTAYGKILPKSILEFPKYGCINIHASVLPKYRGAAPIQWAVLNGESESGVTSMFMAEGLDTGDIILTKTCPVDENETSGQLYNKLSFLGADVMSETLKLSENNKIIRKVQDDNLSCYAPMITKELSPIDWNSSLDSIHNKVRGLNPKPVATALFNGETIKIYSTAKSDKISDKEPGTISVDNGRIFVTCGERKCIELLIIQFPGKKAMSVKDYLRGHELSGKFD